MNKMFFLLIITKWRSKMVVNVILTEIFEKILEALKQKKMNTNNSQIIREALWDSAEKNLPKLYINELKNTSMEDNQLPPQAE